MSPIVIAALVVLVIIVVALVRHGRKKRPNEPCAGACGGATPLCDPATGKCVACTAADTTHCPHGQPFCTVDDQCKLCVGDSRGCPAGQFCLRGDSCVACRADGDCGGRVCKPDHSACVDCLADGDCMDTARPYYDPLKPYCAGNKCVACRGGPPDTCGRDSPAAPHCKDGACARCGADADCGAGMYCAADVSGAPLCVSCVAGDPKRQCAAGEYCVGDPSDPSRAVCVQCVAGDPAHACPAGHACVGGRCVATCASGADCGAGSSTPNCISGLCVACAANSQCAAAFPGLLPYCNNGLCVECLKDASGAQQGCPNPATPLCVESVCEQCFRDTDCKGNPVGPYCQKVETDKGTLYACVACTSDEYCAGKSPATPYCSPNSYACVACDKDHPCPSGKVCGANGRCVDCDAARPCAGGLWCSDPAGGQCVQCRGEADCAGRTATPHCSPSTGLCVRCRDSADCGGSTPACMADGSACVACTANAHCPSGSICSKAAGTANTCVACDADADCTDPNNKYCRGHACTSCQSCGDPAHPNCESGQCLQCRQSQNVMYWIDEDQSVWNYRNNDCDALSRKAIPPGLISCAPGSNACVQCIGDNQCSAGPNETCSCVNGSCSCSALPGGCPPNCMGFRGGRERFPVRSVLDERRMGPDAGLDAGGLGSIYEEFSVIDEFRSHQRRGGPRRR